MKSFQDYYDDCAPMAPRAAPSSSGCCCQLVYINFNCSNYDFYTKLIMHEQCQRLLAMDVNADKD